MVLHASIAKCVSLNHRTIRLRQRLVPIGANMNAIVGESGGLVIFQRSAHHVQIVFFL